MFKTILAKGAPWPKPDMPKVKIIKPHRPRKKRSTKQKTDEMFEIWASKNLGGLL